jgi:probable rRNA maturation factor
LNLVIDFIDETNKVTEDVVDVIDRLLHAAAKTEQIEEGCEVSVTFVTNERIQSINREYRDKDQPTDVISFAMEELGEGEMEVLGAEMPRILGDIIISIEKAKEQANEYDHSFLRELGFLTVHGFLHLLGYDHETEEQERTMFAKQKQILDEFGLIR